MKRAAILLILAGLVSAGAYAATVTPQKGGGIGQFDGGVSSTGGAPITPVGCTPTGLDFSQACNSMYLL